MPNPRPEAHGWKNILIGVGVAVSFIVMGLLQIDDREPVADEIVYLAYAYSIHEHGVFGYAKDGVMPPEPSGDIAPLYPLFLAGLLKFDEDSVRQVQCIVLNKECGAGSSIKWLKNAQVLYFGAMLGIIWYLLFIAFHSYFISLMAVGLIVITGVPAYFANHVLTEILYLPLAILFILLLSVGILEKKSGFIILSFVFLALSALVRPSFYYLAFLMIPVLFLVLIAIQGLDYRKGVLISFLSLLAFAIVTGPWLYRNHVNFGKASITTGYGARAFTTRLAYNEMTNREFLAGWIYYLPDFGDSLARRLFDEENYKRLIEAHPESFYSRERAKVSEELHNNTDVQLSNYHGSGNNSAMGWLIRNKLLADPLAHAKTTLILAWRGVFVDKYFGLFGLAAMFYVFFGNKLRQYRKPLFMLALPCFMLLLFQAAVTLNITRYNIIFLLPMSVALSLIIQQFVFYLMERFGRKKVYSQV